MITLIEARRRKARDAILAALTAASEAHKLAAAAATTPARHQDADDAYRYTQAGLRGLWRTVSDAPHPPAEEGH